MSEALIVDALRTPVGRFRGALAGIRPDDLAARVVSAAVERNGVDPGEIADVYMGAANQAGEDNRDVARMAVLLAGLPVEVPGVTVNRLCASGLEAINQASRALRLGEGDLYLAGGVESMSRAPWVVPKPDARLPRGSWTMHDTALGWRLVNPRMAELHSTEAMGETAENGEHSRLARKRARSGGNSLAAMPTPQLASVDGAISPTTEAMIPLADDGLYRGDGVFEVIRLYEGEPFELNAHLDRLERSAATIELPVDRAALERELPSLLDRLGAEDAALRVIVTRGGRRLLMTEPLPPRGDTVRLATVAYSPSEILNGVKSLSYSANMQATRSAQARDADEALLVRPDGVVLEAPTSSLFWAGADGRLRTPAIDCGILESITRRRLIEALQVEEGAYGIADLRDAREAFLASTTREVQPVAAIDGAALDAPGPRTLEAVDAFGRALAAALRD